MKCFMILLTTFGIISNIYSQSTLLWSADFPAGMNNYYSGTPGIHVIADTIRVMGRITTAGGQRLAIVNYDFSGDTLSTKIYGNDLVLNNSIVDYKFDTSNNIYILQDEKLDFFKSKLVLQKYSPDGELIWAQQVQSAADTSYVPLKLALANDTCIFVTTLKQFNYPELGDDVIMTENLSYLYAFHSQGNLLWQREFDPENEIWYADKIFIHNNTAYFFERNFPSTKIWLIKVDINNNLSIIENTSIPFGVSRIYLTADNHLLLFSGIKYMFSKVTLDGKVLWTKDYGTNLPHNVSGDEVISVIQDTDGNIYVTGRHYGQNYGTSTYTNADILTIKYSKTGNLIWQNRYEYGVNNGDIGRTIRLKNGQIYVGGKSQRLGVSSDIDYVVLKIDATHGNTTGIYRYNGPANGNDMVSSLHIMDNGNVVLTGLSYNYSQYDWTTQFLSDIVLSAPTLNTEFNASIFPNPVSIGGILTLSGDYFNSYQIVSTSGQIIQQEKFEQTNNSYHIHTGNLKAGMYIIQIETNLGKVSRKLIVR
jgi:hypothetical protein